jgi:hypothetical protein
MASRRGIQLVAGAIIAVAALGISHAIGSSAAPHHGAARTVTPIAQASSAAAALVQLPIRGRAPKAGYQRSEFGPAWSDAVNVAGGHNGCDTRTICIRSLPGATLPQ